MKTSEFIEKVEALPFVGEVETSNYMEDILVIRGDEEHAIAFVRIDELHHIDTHNSAFTDLSDEEKAQFMEIAWAYISTPVEERKEKKHFKLRRKDLFQNTNLDRYLTLHGDDVFSEVEFEGSIYKKEFTDWIEMTFDREVLEE